MSRTLARRDKAGWYHSHCKTNAGLPGHLLATHRCPVDGKASYRSRRDAIKALRAIREVNRAEGRGPGPCDVYKGPECGQWHLTSTKNREAHG